MTNGATSGAATGSRLHVSWPDLCRHLNHNWMPQRAHVAGWLAACFALACSPLARADEPPDSFPKTLDSILMGHGVKNVVMGAHVVELSTGRTLYAHDAEKPMLPASNAKLVIMAATIDRLGPEHQFETLLARCGDDLIVIGGGDPSFGDPKLAESRRQSVTSVFRKWSADLKAAGITHIRGRLVFDDSIFDSSFIHPNWPVDQRQSWYEAPIGGLNLADNCVVVSASPGQPGQPAKLSMTPGNTALTLVNRTTTESSTRPTAQRTGSQIIVSGPVSRPCTVAEITVPDPGKYFAAALRTTLAANGISIDGEIARQRVRTADGGLAADVKTIARHRVSMADALGRAGKNSLGMMAEGLIKTLGAAENGTGTWTSGAAVVEHFVHSCGGSQGQFHFDDGSGLSRENRLSPATMTIVLKHMFNARGRDLLMASLSHAGVDGTLEKRMREVKGRVIGKTGYIGGVRTLAGYIHTQDDRWLAFAFFYNNATATQPLTHAQDEACRYLVTGAAPRSAVTSQSAKSAAQPRRGKPR